MKQKTQKEIKLPKTAHNEKPCQPLRKDQSLFELLTMGWFGIPTKVLRLFGLIYTLLGIIVFFFGTSLSLLDFDLTNQVTGLIIALIGFSIMVANS